MIIKFIKIHNFRNYNSLEVQFENGINNIFGNNGIGKTNLVEAIYYLTNGKSFKENNEKNLINLKEKKFYLNGKIFIGNNLKNIEIFFDDTGKKIKIDNKNIFKLSDLALNFNSIYYAPEDVNFFKGSPSNRRNLLNLLISKINKEYFINLTNYNKVLKNKNILLKEENPNIELINTYNKMLINYSYEIFKVRRDFLLKMNEYIPLIYSKITNISEKIILKYFSFINELNKEKYLEIGLNKMNEALNNDLKFKRSTIGIHLEDYMIFLNDKNISIFGSQGQNRMATIAFKLAPYYLIDNFDKKPIIILDDILSELDTNHQNNLLELLKEFEQVFITSVNKITKENVKNFTLNNINELEEVYD